jgi:two-component system, response regulator PdtaR
MPEQERKRIQIVEDEGIVADEIRSRLKNLGYEVVGIADTGPKAITLAGIARPDLVLMDIMLKGEMDGVEAADIIRTTFDIPIIYLTAYTDEGTLKRAKITKPFGYLIKPFEERELRTTIEISLYNHHMERLLAESEERYRVVSELSSDFAFSFIPGEDESFTLEWITDAFTTITGYSTDDVDLPNDLKRIIHGDDLPILLGYLGARPDDTQMLKEATHGFDFRLFTKAGEMRWIHGFLRPEWNDHGDELVRCYGAMKDITLRKRIQDLIRIQRDLGMSLSSTGDLTTALDLLLSAMIQVSGIDCGALYLIDKETGGMDLTAHKGLPFQFIDIMHYDSSSPQTRFALAGKPIYGHFTETTSPLDNIRSVDDLRALAMIPVTYEDDVVAALSLASRTQDDIPTSSRIALEAIASQVGVIIARVRTEMALRESEEKYRLITEAVSEGILKVALDGTIEYANPGFIKRIGIPLEEVQGRKLETLIRQMHVPEMKMLLEDVIYGNYYETEMWLRCQDGVEVLMNISASPLRDEGRIRGIIMIISPIQRNC